MLFCSLSELRPNLQGAVELRVDLLREIDLKKVEKWMAVRRASTLLTYRGEDRGLLAKLLALGPPFFDLDVGLGEAFISEMIQRHPQTKFIVSHHDFEKIPDLEKVYLEMKKFPAYFYKIAARASSSSEALRMLLFGRKYRDVSVICMGEKGSFARILGPVFGNLIHFCALESEKKTAPGQLSVEELKMYGNLDEKTEIYGLIGDPVEKSLGHIYHNRVFQKKEVRAVYVKIAVGVEEVGEFISLAKEAGFKGLSVTMPLKEAVGAFVDCTFTDAGAINTLRFENGKVLGINTDGVGAFDAIEKRIDVKGKRLAILGAGGASRAIGFEGRRRGAKVSIFNRSLKRAKWAAEELGAEVGILEDLRPDYDLIINTTASACPILEEQMAQGVVAMDINYNPSQTPFLTLALSKRCEVIYGDEMFECQAARQTAFWLREK